MLGYIEDGLQAYQRCVNRASYYEEQKNYEQALKEYASAFWQWNFAWRSIEALSGGQYSNVDEKLTFLFEIAPLVNSVVINYYRLLQKRKASFFSKILKELVEVLGEYQDRFDAEQIQVYETLTSCSASSNLLTKDVEELQPEDIADRTFQELRKNFNDICEISICLLQPRQTSDGSKGDQSRRIDDP